MRRRLVGNRDRRPMVELCFLPSYAGHRENPLEKVWWRMKQRPITLLALQRRNWPWVIP